MASTLLKSTVVLAFSRFANYSLLILSPIILVRVLDPHGFGQYREFMAYAMLLAGLATFAAPTSLLYFIPHQPSQTRYYVSNTNWMVLATSSTICLFIWLFREQLLANISADFLLQLALYVFLFVNLDFVESYWLARKQANNVFYYSTSRTAIRLTVVIATAAMTKSVSAVLNALVIVEIARVLVVLVIMQRSQLLSFAVSPKILKQQLAFVLPLGLASSLHMLNIYVGQIAISAKLGVVALAIYAIGNYQVPILDIVRSAISDAIFPDMVREAAQDDADRLRLWKRGNIAYSFLIAPFFVALMWYADVLIPLVFTDEYVAAIPIFRILLLVMIIQCFELSSPLRAANRNRLLLGSNVLLLGTNVICILLFFRFLPDIAIFGPAAGLVLGYLVQLTFLGWSVTRVYAIRVSQLLKWRGLATIGIASLLACPILALGELVEIPEIIRIVVFSALFGALYFLIVYRARLDEVETLIATFSRKLSPIFRA